jgi:hypothetical protein
MCAMLRSGLVRRSDNRPSGLIFLFIFIFGPSQPWPVVGPFEFWLLVSPGQLSAHFEVWLVVNPGPLSARYGVWSIVGHFGSAFTSHLPPSLAAGQPLSSPTASTIYELFLTSATVVIIVSDFKLKVAEYSTLSLRGDVRIYYSLGLLSFLLEFILEYIIL